MRSNGVDLYEVTLVGYYSRFLGHAAETPMPILPHTAHAPMLILHLTLVGRRGSGEVVVGPWFGSCSVTEFEMG